MTPERWRRVSELFHQALDRDAHSRDEFLQQACAEDMGLRQDVASLLEAHARGEAQAFLEGSTAAGGQGRWLSQGARLGPYEIVELLGVGGMGEVYRARDPRLGREVAIKVLPAEMGSDPDRRRRFAQEARAAGTLNHPNVLAVYDVGTEGEVPFVVSELLEGETLRARLARGAMGWREAVDCARQAVAGLAAAHDKGIVHRDLKPENLFLTGEGRVKVLDFGLAKLSAPAAATGSPPAAGTIPGLLMGTIGYMAPEQARGSGTDHRADVFSLGVVLYEMVAGRRAFTGPSAADALAALLHGEPPSLAELRVDAPRALDELVRRCLRKDARERFQGSRELLSALDAVASEAPAAGPRPAAVAVLPFMNTGREPDLDYFCEGIADELIGALTREGLRVAARGSVHRLQASGFDLRRIGEELCVGKVLEGSVRRSGPRLRVLVSLVDVAEGCHVWSERYEREVGEVFEVQDDIVSRVVRTLAPALMAGRQASRVPRRPPEPDAYHLYLRGRYAWNKRHEGHLLSAVRHFEEALARDRSFAAAQAGLAETLGLLGSFYAALPPRDAMPRAVAAAESALALDDTMAEAYAARGWVRFHYHWDRAGAEEDFHRSLALEPERGATRHWYSFLLSSMSRHDEAEAEARRAWESDPFSMIINCNLAQPPWYARRFEETLARGEKAVQMDAAFGVAHFWVGLAQDRLGDHRAAAAAFEKFAALTARRGAAHAGYAWARAGERDKAARVLRDLEDASTRAFVPAADFALVHAGLGDKEAALEWLEKAEEERSDQLAYVEVDPLWDSLRGDPRFAALVRRVGARW